MKRVELQPLSHDDLIVRRSELMRKLMVAQFQLKTGQLENTASLKQMRRDLARLNTELRGREIAEGVARGSMLHRHVASGAAASEAKEVVAAPVGRRSRFGLGFIRDTLLGRRS